MKLYLKIKPRNKYDMFFKAARKTPQIKAPKGGVGKYPGGRFIPGKALLRWADSLSGDDLSVKQKVLFNAAKEFLKMIVDDRIYVNNKESFYWALEPSDFVKLVCGKGDNEFKGGLRTRQEREQVFWNILFKKHDALELSGFEEYRAQKLMKIAGHLFENSQYMKIGKDKSDLSGKVYHFEQREKRSNPTLVTSVFAGENNEYHRPQKGEKLHPISLHYKKWNSLKRLMESEEVEK